MPVRQHSIYQALIKLMNKMNHCSSFPESHFSESHSKVVLHIDTQNRRGRILGWVYPVVFVCVSKKQRESTWKTVGRMVWVKNKRTHKLHLPPFLWFSGSVKPRCRKQDLCGLIKFLYNYLYLQLQEAGTGEFMGLWAKQRGRNFCPLLLIVAKIDEWHVWARRRQVFFGGA